MAMSADWHQGMIEAMGAFFEQDADARAVIVSGSVVDSAVTPDMWSDVDIKVILADAAVGRYFPATDWLQRFGQVIGVERHDGALSKTLRVCLDDYRRVDLVLVPETSLAVPSFWFHGSLQAGSVIVWSRPSTQSRLPDLAQRLSDVPEPPPFVPASEADVLAMADPFWFQAAVAIGKVVRDDLLIGAHMALDLVRTVLVLQMLRRDREFCTNVHRTGGWGNEVVEMVRPEVAALSSACAILDLVEKGCTTFDTLAVDLAPSYTPRADRLRPAIEAAREALGV